MNSPKIALVTALYSEAKPFIKALSLKQSDAPSNLQIFENVTHKLIITGTGKVCSAVGTTFLLSKLETPSIILNFGICGAKNESIGEVFLVDHILDNDSERTFYTDIFCTSPSFPRKSLRTVSKPDASQSFDELIDMEASGFYEAASNFLPAHKILILKQVSDNADKEILDKYVIEKNISLSVPGILSYLQTCTQSNTENSESQEIQNFLMDLYKEIHFTKSEQIAMRKLIINFFAHEMKIEDIKKIYRGKFSAKEILNILTSEMKTL